ncbi:MULTISPECIES: succinate dehydrogenase assembly factor 2 [Rhodomicrobium]|uniref:FAD assembly factor SdhE n=1 Tax=Rhodomicrobium TaxID=1068 RepID=UPI000B4B8E0A|nr:MULTISPECIES: succinate dehydrogenase assembly factor 2 [Rhodomicrobium]
MTGTDSRIKRAFYRAQHRGTKELDFILGRFAHAELAGFDAAELTAFEELLALPDPQIDLWIKGDAAPPGVQPMIARIRRFHRLES